MKIWILYIKTYSGYIVGGLGHWPFSFFVIFLAFSCTSFPDLFIAKITCRSKTGSFIAWISRKTQIKRTSFAESEASSLTAVLSCQLNINLTRITDTEVKLKRTSVPQLACQPTSEMPRGSCYTPHFSDLSTCLVAGQTFSETTRVQNASMVFSQQVGWCSRWATAAACKFVWMCLYGVVGVKEGCNLTPILPLLDACLSFSLLRTD